MIWDIDREIVSWGHLALRWYSLLFALGFVIGYFIIQDIFKKEGKSLQLLDSLLFYLVVGTVVGARLGHCLFYEPQDYLTDPIRILKVWEGGLASHGGFTGVILALLLFCRKNKDLSFFWLADRVAIPSMLTGAMIRVGNFFNSEIIGRPSDVPWAVIFKKVDMVPRHPSQLYEALGYLVITGILYATYRIAGRKPMEGRILGMVLALGFAFRIFIEFFKENQEAFEASMPLNMGQLLSIPFILFGLFLIFGGQFRVPLLRRGLSAEALAERGYATSEPETLEAAQAASRRGQVRKQSKKAKK